MSVENVTAELLTLRVIGKDQENASFAMPLYIQKRSLHQDRLGTNTGETQKRDAFSAGLRLGGVYQARVRGYNVAGAGEWSDGLEIYAFEDGACANEADATIWNANLAQFSEAMGSCCGGEGCHRHRLIIIHY